MSTQAAKSLAMIWLSGISALKAGRFSQWAAIYRFDKAGHDCLMATSLHPLTEDSDASTVQEALDVLSAELVSCLDQAMRAAGYTSRGTFVGDETRVTKDFGDGHALIAFLKMSYNYFKALPQGHHAYLQLRFFYWPAAPQLPQWRPIAAPA